MKRTALLASLLVSALGILHAQDALVKSDWSTLNNVWDSSNNTNVSSTVTEDWGTTPGGLTFTTSDPAQHVYGLTASYASNLSLSKDWNAVFSVKVPAYDATALKAGQLVQPNVNFAIDQFVDGAFTAHPLQFGVGLYSVNGTGKGSATPFTMSGVATWALATGGNTFPSSYNLYASNPALYDALIPSEKAQTNLNSSYSFTAASGINVDYAFSYTASQHLFQAYFKVAGDSAWNMLYSADLSKVVTEDVFNPQAGESYTAYLSVNLMASGAGKADAAPLVAAGDVALTGFSYDGTSAGSFAAVPEPSFYAALTGFAALGVGVWRRRSRTSLSDGPRERVVGSASCAESLD